MRRIQKVSDIIEVIAEKSFLVGLAGIGALILSFLVFTYLRAQGVVGGWMLAIAGVGLIGYAIKNALTIREVTKFDVTCPYCNETNQVTTLPEDDFTCSFCHRLIPILDHKPLPVMQVRCGYCNALNFYSEKTQILLCEECNHEIPISTSDDDTRPKKTLAAAYALVDDENIYELVLVGKGKKTEDLINTLQHMLALNRNQVKQMLDELPVVLLTGINRRKAEMLQAQLSLHDGVAEFRPVSQQTPVG